MGKDREKKKKKGRGRNKWRGKGEEKWCEAKENCQKPRFLLNFHLCGAPVPSTHPTSPIWATFVGLLYQVPTQHARSGPHLARKCRPMVYYSMPNFIVIHYYI